MSHQSVSERIINSLNPTPTDIMELELEIEDTKQQLELLLALKQVLYTSINRPQIYESKLQPKQQAKPKPPDPQQNGDDHQHKPLPKPKTSRSDVRDGPTNKPSRLEKSLSRRKSAAEYIATNGPQKLLELGRAIGVPDGTMNALVDHPWFEREAGKIVLTSDGYQEVRGKTQQEDERDPGEIM